GRDLVRIAIEHQRWPPAEVADAPLGRLAPAGVVDGRVHVRVEAVFVGCRLLPGRLRALGDEADPHDRLGALEAVLPRDDATNRALPVGSTRLISDARGNPIHGMTIDQPSTQRSR